MPDSWPHHRNIAVRPPGRTAPPNTHRETTVNDEPTTHDPRTGPRRLTEFAPDGPAAATPAVTLSGGPDVVVLRRAETAMVEVCQGHQILTLVDDAEATPITDPAHRDDLIRRALRTVAVQRYAATQQVLQARGERDRQQDAHAAVLRDIRCYAIDRHLDNEICREGLDTFLERFNLDPYQPRLRVRFRIIGSIEVDTEDRSAAEHQVDNYLGLDLSSVDNAVDDSEEIQVSVTGFEQVRD